MDGIKEDLLKVWLELSAAVSNKRLTKTLPFNEAVVCYFLHYNYIKNESMLTATDLCREMKMLKSLMNATLKQLETKGVIEKVQSKTDKRQIFIKLTAEGEDIFQKQHGETMEIIEVILARVKEDEIVKVIPILREITNAVENYTKEDDLEG